MSGIRVEWRLKNAALHAATVGKYGSVAAFIRAAGLASHTQGPIGDYLSLKRSPWLRSRGFETISRLSALATKICAFCGMEGWELFAPALYEVPMRRGGAFIVDGNHLLATDSLPKFLAPPAPVNPEEARMREEALEQMYEAMQGLPPREQQIIKTRFGLDAENGSTYEETARRLGISRERVRQIEIKAMDRLRPAVREAWASLCESERAR